MSNFEKITQIVEKKTQKNIPASIKIEYLDYLDFSKLKIPKEILECPVITISENETTKIIINQTMLSEYEYYVAEIFTAQLLELLKDPEENKSTFLINKNITLGKAVFSEFIKIQTMLSILKETYKEEEINPYTNEENIKIAESIALSAVNKKENKLSSFLYSLARVTANYDYQKCIRIIPLAQELNNFNKLLKSKEKKDNKYFLKIGKTAKKIKALS